MTKCANGQKAAVENTGFEMDSARQCWRKVKNLNGSAGSVLWKVDNDADLTALIDAIWDGLQSLPPTAVYDGKAGPNNPVAIFPVSDLHAGLLMDEQELDEKWDFKIARAHFLRTFGGWYPSIWLPLWSKIWLRVFGRRAGFFDNDVFGG